MLRHQLEWSPSRLPRKNCQTIRLLRSARRCSRRGSAVTAPRSYCNQLSWDTYPEKILLLAAWHEARGGGAPWKSSDMDTVFKQAKEAPPSNFPRDIKAAIKSGWIHTHTPRTYSVTRTGWNRVGDAVARLSA